MKNRRVTMLLAIAGLGLAMSGCEQNHKHRREPNGLAIRGELLLDDIPSTTQQVLVLRAIGDGSSYLGLAGPYYEPQERHMPAKSATVSLHRSTPTLNLLSDGGFVWARGTRPSVLTRRVRGTTYAMMDTTKATSVDNETTVAIWSRGNVDYCIAVGGGIAGFRLDGGSGASSELELKPGQFTRVGTDASGKFVFVDATGAPVSTPVVESVDTIEPVRAFVESTLQKAIEAEAIVE